MSLRFRTAAAVALMLSMWSVSGAFAQGGRGHGGGMRPYDVRTEATVHGTVTDVRNVTSRMGGRGGGGTHVMLNTGSETLDVHLGPAAALKELHLEIAAGDVLDVTGSRVKMAGADVLIARQVRKDDASFTLRDATGRPVWSGRGGR